MVNRFPSWLVRTSVRATFGVLILLVAVSSVPAQESTATLYSEIKHRGKRLKSCLRFRHNIDLPSPSCDLRYGNLYLNEDHDWFEISGAQNNRSVIRDLGKHEWSDDFIVPVIKPLPKLKQGEQRRITIDASGARGADGRPGADGKRGRDGDQIDPVGRWHDVNDANEYGHGTPTAPPKKAPRVDPIFTKAKIGHIYAIHVVDEIWDYYVLVRVDALSRGDNCTVSWRIIPSPETARNK